ncbi:SRPBCC family protein [Lysobacter sp. CA196]|uniref:SRPBCC family protein n=1 Tax=Lysobacter sp. CA196 TaxID=3455606 RepID=UPI003F8D49E7
MNASTDRIEKQILLKAPRTRVWQALADAESFGEWFGVRFEGQRFVPGQTTQGRITYPGYEHLLMQVEVQRVEPERLLSFHWHPYAVDPEVDYSQEAPTLVEFTLEEVDGGTLLRVVESGFDRVPASRRDEAFRMNSGGWDEQMSNIERYVG